MGLVFAKHDGRHLRTGEDRAGFWLDAERREKQENNIIIRKTLGFSSLVGKSVFYTKSPFAKKDPGIRLRQHAALGRVL